MEIIAEVISWIIKGILTPIFELAFETGFFIFDLLNLNPKKVSKENLPYFRKILISVVGAITITGFSIFIVLMLIKT